MDSRRRGTEPEDAAGAPAAQAAEPAAVREPVSRSGSVSGSMPRTGKASAQPAGGGKIRDIFLSRLSELESRVERELDRRDGAGPVPELALDLLRESWRLAAGFAGAVAGGPGSLLASWTASAPVDELGFDAALAETLRELLRPFARHWLGLREHRSSPLPSSGGVLVLCNRSGWPLPVEALLLQAFLADGRAGARRIVALWPQGPELPWASDLLRGIGIVEASSSNASLLLERGAIVLAFPEGSSAEARLYDRRYRLTRFEDPALFEAAIEAGARIVPAAVVGNEESFPLLGRLGGLPLTAQFPLLGPFGLLPLPVTWTLRLGPALELPPGAGPDAVTDAVRVRMQALLGELLAARRSGNAGR